jgi:tetratricopeptide (TPR) repeat protein
MVYKYNPGFLSDEDSIRTFVVRQKDFQIVLEVLNENSHASANRHVLVIGPRGSGKSTLARRLVAELRTNASLAEIWYPVLLGEESYTVTSAGEFWLECVFQLAEQCTSSDVRAQLQARHREIQLERNNTRLRELAVGVITSFAAEMRRRILLVVENFNMIMEEQLGEHEGWTIRHALQNVPEIMLFATATKRFDQSSDKALFEQFKVHELRPLTMPEISTLWTSLTHEKIARERNRPIQILTGGSPRLIAILADFAVNHSFKDLMGRLSSLIDQYTDYFKSQLDSLPAAERKVFVSVLEHWDPATTRQIAEEARMPVNATSSHLNRLRMRGAIQKRAAAGSQHWEASERLFNLYYLMRRRGAPSSRVEALVRFMTVYYERDQLYQRATDLAKECSTLHPSMRDDHYAALARIAQSFDDNKKAHIFSLTPPDFPKHFEALIAPTTNTTGAPPMEPSTLRKRIHSLITKRKVRDALGLLAGGDFAKRQYAGLWAYVAMGIAFEEDNFEEGYSLLDKATRLDETSGVTWFVRGLLLKAQARYLEAVESFKKAIEIDADDAEAWLELGETYEELFNLEQAEEAYRAAISKEATNANAWSSLGLLLARREVKIKEAEAALRRAVELKPNDANYLGRLGNFLLVEYEATSQAEDIAREILKRDLQDERAWNLLIRTLSRAGRSPHEIDVEFSAALRSTPPKSRARVREAYAAHLDRIHEHDRAEEIRRESVKENPKSGFAWLRLARNLAPHEDKQPKALEAFSKALELSPTDPTAWMDFGSFLSKRTERDADAEEALRKASELGPNECATWNALGAHLLRSTRVAEASECFQRAMKINPGCVCALGNYSDALASQTGELQNIVKMVEAFIQRVPASPYPHIVLARHFASLGGDKPSAVKHLLTALNKGFSAERLTTQFLQSLTLEDTQRTVHDIEQYLAATKKDDAPRDALAWGMHQMQVKGDLLQYAISLSRDAVEKSRLDWSRRHTLAALLVDAGDIEEALAEVHWLAEHIPSQPVSVAEQALDNFIELCVELARSERNRLLDVLEASSSKDAFEPLMVALKLRDGEEPNVAREILEVARDIYNQIESTARGAHSASLR